MIDWGALTGRPLSSMTGPFPKRPFLEAWWRHRGVGELEVVSAGDAAVSIVVTDGVARLAGEADLTDYHSPLGSNMGRLAEAVVAAVGGDVTFEFDSLPDEAAGPMHAAWRDAGRPLTRSGDGTCWVLDLGPGSTRPWEERLAGRDRHELRRKRRRFADRFGPPRVVQGSGFMADFVALHRQASGTKGEFMTEAMAEFFAELIDTAGFRLDVLRVGEDRPAAAAFGFEDEDAYYLYNSAFDVDLADVSPGIVLIDALIHRAGGGGARRFDFLKGDEPYKRRLGATARPLWRLESP